jgi:hypothetical protein
MAKHTALLHSPISASDSFCHKSLSSSRGTGEDRLAAHLGYVGAACILCCSRHSCIGYLTKYFDMGESYKIYPIFNGQSIYIIKIKE